MRRSRILLCALLSVACAGCAGHRAAPGKDAGPVPAAPRTTATAAAEVGLTGGGTFRAYAEGVPAVVYDRELVPRGARAEVTVESSGGQTVSELRAHGLRPDRDYGVHLHVRPCGADPDDSGPHYARHRHAAPTPDTGTAQPESTASPTPNPMGEVWLDITTDVSGNGTATARQPWALPPGDLPRSLVIHARATDMSGPDAGQAGDRVACLTLTPAGDG